MPFGLSVGVKEGALLELDGASGKVSKLQDLVGEPGAKGEHKKGITAFGNEKLFYTVGTTLVVISMDKVQEPTRHSFAPNIRSSAGLFVYFFLSFFLRQMEVTKKPTPRQILYMHYDDLVGGLVGLIETETAGVLRLVSINQNTGEFSTLLDLPSTDSPLIACTYAPSEKIFAVLFERKLLAISTKRNKLVVNQDVELSTLLHLFVIFLVKN